MKDKLNDISSSIKTFFGILFNSAWKVIKFLSVNIVWRFFNYILDKIKIWFKSTKARHWIFAFITFVLIATAIDDYGIFSMSTLYIFLYFMYAWCATYLLKYLNENQSIKGRVSHFVAIVIFAITFISSLFVIPIIFDMVYFKGSFYIENGSMVTLLMVLLIFTSPGIQIIAVRGFGMNIKPEYNYRKYVLILLTAIIVMKVTNDFELVYTQAHDNYLCVEEEQNEYCNELSEPYVTFETDTTLWMMNEVAYQSVIIVFLLDNIIPKNSDKLLNK